MSTKPVFIHISKNAGTSIIHATHDNIVVAGHRTAASWVAENGRSATLFAVVRNPFDRVVSEYFFRKHRFDGGDDNPHLANLIRPFDDWVVATYRDGEFRSRAFFEASGIFFNDLNMIGDSLIWLIPQTRWLGDETGAMLVDDLLRYESLEDDWRRFAAKNRFSERLEHHNASRQVKDFRSYYSDRAHDVVADYFREDLEAYGYQFD